MVIVTEAAHEWRAESPDRRGAGATAGRRGGRLRGLGALPGAGVFRLVIAVPGGLEPGARNGDLPALAGAARGGWLRQRRFSVAFLWKFCGNSVESLWIYC